MSRTGRTPVSSAATGEPLSIQLQRTIRRKIILGEYPQGLALTEQRVAADLDVSRVPVREAMPVLQQQGFVEASPRRTSYVTTWTAQRINDLFDARLGVEVVAVGGAARRTRAGIDTAGLEQMLAKAEHHLDEGEALELAETNSAVHVTLVAAAGNELLNELMRVISGRLAWIFYLTSSRDLRNQVHEHHAITEAIRNGNDRLAESLMWAHIEAGRAPTLDALVR
ncbi:GntR family transcriptional regulator [Nocardia sp. CA2R105]|uniref:GntR family transcriptional regulator n=1 Tax=Nocardia coffeae TaxID=2873381 RepID=UPI001CA6E296|nr:GntR family transcriptional regulator [Nocardia coffeae]MBY8855142.1 GntR family transcriptional regulator [Nocardia coffeae]